MTHQKIKTTFNVWAATKNSHPELKVFSSYSAPDGDMFGDPDICVMMTEYGFNNSDYPIIGAKTTWDRVTNSIKRTNEKTEYWLCVAINEEE